MDSDCQTNCRSRQETLLVPVLPCPENLHSLKPFSSVQRWENVHAPCKVSDLQLPCSAKFRRIQTWETNLAQWRAPEKIAQPLCWAFELLFIWFAFFVKVTLFHLLITSPRIWHGISIAWSVKTYTNMKSWCQPASKGLPIKNWYTWKPHPSSLILRKAVASAAPSLSVPPEDATRTEKNQIWAHTLQTTNMILECGRVSQLLAFKAFKQEGKNSFRLQSKNKPQKWLVSLASSMAFSTNCSAKRSSRLNSTFVCLFFTTNFV